ncbi:hypothetical protein J6590_100135, partial [Homalodisca vitripennis]
RITRIASSPLSKRSADHCDRVKKEAIAILALPLGTTLHYTRRSWRSPAADHRTDSDLFYIELFTK